MNISYLGTVQFIVDIHCRTCYSHGDRTHQSVKHHLESNHGHNSERSSNVRSGYSVTVAEKHKNKTQKTKTKTKKTKTKTKTKTKIKNKNKNKKQKTKTKNKNKNKNKKQKQKQKQKQKRVGSQFKAKKIPLVQ